MIDIFDIIDKRKDIQIRIEGTVYSDSLFYDSAYINELTSIVLDNQKEVEFITFNITEDKNYEPELISARDLRVRTLRSDDVSIEFDIDIFVTNKLYKMFDEDMIGFINYYTKGAIRYDGHLREVGITTDDYEEYRSRPMRSSELARVSIDWNDIVNRTVPAYEFDYYGALGSGNWADADRDSLRIHRTHDADGDGAIFAAMFNSTERPVIGGRE